MTTCYMCNSLATSSEHTPPRSIFPKSSSYRTNLIKVPSCDVHNSSKSKDDELVRHVLACAPGNNDLAHKVVNSVLRSFDRKPHIIGSFFPDLNPVTIGGEETASFTIDLDRFHTSIQSMVRALYYNLYEDKLFAPLTVAWAALMTNDFSEAPFLEMIRKGELRFGAMKEGENKEVFQYDFHVPPDRLTGVCRLRFYEGHPIYVAW